MINDMAREFTKKYFKSEYGIKCTMGWPWRSDENGNPRHVGYPKPWFCMKSIVDKDFTDFRTLHQFSYIFEDIDKSSEEGWHPSNNVVGVGAVIDIDSPYIEGSKSKRLDCLLDNNVIDLFEDIRLIIKDKLMDYGDWDDARMMFSGNGIYFILADQYGDKDELNQYVSNFIEMCKDVNWKSGMDLIDIKNSYPWNEYFKAPFTMHWKFDRLAIPLDKDQVLDKDYLKKHSGLCTNVEKVVRDSKW